jgi:hypothetical protein
VVQFTDLQALNDTEGMTRPLARRRNRWTTAVIMILGGGLIAFPQETQPGPQYSRTRNFGAVRLSQTQLLDVLNTIEALAATANADFKDRKVERSLTVEDGTNSVEVTGAVTAASLEGAADPANIVRYSYRVFSVHVSSSYVAALDPLPIEKIELTIWGPSGTIKVSGRSQGQVEAIAAVMNEAVEKWHPAVIGNEIETALISLTAVFFLAIWIVAIVAAARLRPRMLFVPLVTLLLWFLPWARWIPDVAVYRGEPSLIVRYSGWFTFLAFVLAVVSMLLAFKGQRPVVEMRDTPPPETAREARRPDTGYRDP